ncbi:MAG TPA: PRC-barrel domain-containing protein [Acetobacteraceae bacterium]|nr:PRC-barrel domain-containing protein [Acetobacteraceae bacterium]
MPYLRSIGVMTLAATLVALQAAAQQTPSTDAAPAASPPADTSTAAPQAAPAAPAPPATPTPGNVPGVVATTNNPNLAVAAVKLENGVRASKIIGAPVRGDTDQDIGKVDDLIMTEGNKVTVAIVSVGGFLGLGSKLVAFPFDQLRMQGDRILVSGVTKDSLNAMPSFQY